MPHEYFDRTGMILACIATATAFALSARKAPADQERIGIHFRSGDVLDQISGWLMMGESPPQCGRGRSRSIEPKSACPTLSLALKRASMP